MRGRIYLPAILAAALASWPVLAAQNAPRRLWSLVVHDLSRPQTPADYFVGTQTPRRGEIALAVKVLNTSGPRQQMSVGPLAFRLPSGRAAAVAAGKTKTVILPPGQASVFFRVGDELVIVGQDHGPGRPLPARIIFGGK